MKYYTKENGRSMVEMMGYMMVVMVFIVAVGRIVANAFDEYKFSRASLQLSEFASTISRAGAVDPDYSDVIAMIKGTYNKGTTQQNNLKNKEGLKLIPLSYKMLDREIRHAFGGLVTVDVVSGNNNRFYIMYSGLERRQCIELALKNWEKNKYVDLYSIVINDEYSWYWPIYNVAEGLKEFSLPTTRSAIAGIDDNGQCSKTHGNTIMWIFN